MFNLPLKVEKTTKNAGICAAIAIFLLWSGLWIAALFFTVFYHFFNNELPIKLVNPSGSKSDTDSGDPL